MVSFLKKTVKDYYRGAWSKTTTASVSSEAFPRDGIP